MKNTHIYCALLLCFSVSSAYSKDSTSAPSPQVQSPQVLSPQVLVAEPAHLTTRIEWAKFPVVQYHQADLKQKDRHAIVRIKADEKGQVVQAKIQESTGLAKLDHQLLKAVQAAKTKPIKKDGINQTLVGYQTFSFRLNDQASAKSCNIIAQSNNWNKQQADKSVAFEYLKTPNIEVSQDVLRHQDRSVKVKFKVNKQGDVEEAKLTKLSGVNAIDQRVLEHILQQKVSLHRTVKTLWIYKKSTLSDVFQLNLKDCA